MWQSYRMFDGRQAHRPMLVASGAAALLLVCSAIAHAADCGGGMDATGNECSGEQVRELSSAESRLLFLQGQVAMAELRAARARQRLTNGTAEVEAAKISVQTTETELNSARIALGAAQKTGQGSVAIKTR